MHSVIAQPFDAPQEEMSKRVWWIVRGSCGSFFRLSFCFLSCWFRSFQCEIQSSSLTFSHLIFGLGTQAVG